MKLKVMNSVRTNNFNDDLLLHKITKLWEQASNDLANQVVTKYGVYHNYESDYKGDYSLSIALKIITVNLYWNYRITQNMKSSK